MASDFPGRIISGIWAVLYDDDHLSDDRGIGNGIIPVPGTAVYFLYSVYSDIARKSRGQGDLFFPAGRRYSDTFTVRGAYKAHEAADPKKYGKRNVQTMKIK